MAQKGKQSQPVPYPVPVPEKPTVWDYIKIISAALIYASDPRNLKLPSLPPPPPCGCTPN
jgi:hypothetical protein